MRPAPEIAEAIGTFFMVLAGAGAIMANASTFALGHWGVAATWGLVIAAMIYAVGHVSGAHFNPAVTLSFAATHHFPWKRVPTYIAAQSLGALAAALILRWVMGDVANVGATDFDEVGLARGFAVEVLITAMLMFVIAAVATDGRATGTMAGIAIGATVGLNAMWSGPLTTASMNPARSLGPAIASGELAGLWVYILAPIIGAMIGAHLYELVRRGEKPVKGAP